MNSFLLMSILGPEAMVVFIALLPFIIVIFVIRSKNKRIAELEKEVSYFKGVLDRK
jgi:hypothetical protein